MWPEGAYFAWQWLGGSETIAIARDTRESFTIAGDSFLGAMVWAIGTGHGLEDAFRYGMDADPAAVLPVGTGLCQADDVRRLYEQVRIERL